MNDLHKLKEMGLQLWQVRDHSIFATIEQKEIQLPAECKLLYVSFNAPLAEQVDFFGKVLASIGLNPEQALYLPPEAALNVKILPEWCWFAGVTPHDTKNTKLLVSCNLHQLEYDIESKRQLWQQIKKYDPASST